MRCSRRISMRDTTALLAMFFLLSTATPLSSQSVGAGSAASEPRVCRGRTDGNTCGLRTLPEFAAFVGGNTASEIKAGYRIGVGLGITTPLGARSAVGASLWALAHDGLSASLLARYRYWAPGGAVWDVGIGGYIAGDMNNIPMRFPSLIAEVGVAYRDWIGLTGRVERITFYHWRLGENLEREVTGTFPDNVFLIGAKVGRGLGVLGYAAAAVFIVVAAATCC